MINTIHFQSLFRQFRTEGVIDNVHAFGSGHINDTYRLTTKSPLHYDYIYQRINHDVFKDIKQLMNNIHLVTDHIRNKLIAQGVSHPEWRCLTLVPTQEGKWYHRDENNDYWSSYIFIPGRSFDLVPSPHHAMQGGKLYGEFLHYVSDIDVSQIADTIPNFHNINSRIDQFELALANNAAKRKLEVMDLITFARDHAEQMRVILQLGISGKIPTRVTHNDTKFNNILLDDNNEALCVLDLDTVMPGYLHYDYSDAIRTAASTAKEDEADLSKVDIDINLFKGFCSGFLPAIRSDITDTELALLAPSTHLLPYIIGLRFLTDYINGDTYFKTHYAQQNLARARAQFQLVRQIDKKMPELESIINAVIES